MKYHLISVKTANVLELYPEIKENFNVVYNKERRGYIITINSLKDLNKLSKLCHNDIIISAPEDQNDKPEITIYDDWLE